MPYIYFGKPGRCLRLSEQHLLTQESYILVKISLIIFFNQDEI